MVKHEGLGRGDMRMEDSKIAIVTAAGKGIGAAIARELAAHGYRLALMSSGGGAERLAADLGGIGLTGSVTAPADIELLVGRTVETYGRIDAVINNTGHPAKGPLLEISDEAWHQGLDLLMLNVVRMARLVTPIMRQQGGGAQVNISTFAAFEPDAAFPYADRHARDGIRMNNVLPGFVDNYPESEENLARIPMARYARAEEIAATVRFLVSPASAYITGQNIRVDGSVTRSL
jgi:NAD(P)-dependent dehydrogenase (short-subunit alcohol dehydrogenase family)